MATGQFVSARVNRVSFCTGIDSYRRSIDGFGDVIRIRRKLIKVPVLTRRSRKLSDGPSLVARSSVDGRFERFISQWSPGRADETADAPNYSARIITACLPLSFTLHFVPATAFFCYQQKT